VRRAGNHAHTLREATDVPFAASRSRRADPVLICAATHPGWSAGPVGSLRRPHLQEPSTRNRLRATGTGQCDSLREIFMNVPW
jgi:hypothetical protein